MTLSLRNLVEGLLSDYDKGYAIPYQADGRGDCQNWREGQCWDKNTRELDNITAPNPNIC